MLDEAAAKLGAHKAYLQVPGNDSPAKNFFFISAIMGGETTDVALPLAEATNRVGAPAYYTLGGQRLKGRPTQPGVYVVNGRKVVIR